MQDSLNVLTAVNQFYSQAFAQLITVTIAILAFAGVLMPILLSLYQKRIFRLEHKEIENKIESRFLQLAAELKEEINEKFREKDKESKKEILALENKMDKEIAATLAGILHVQGNQLLRVPNATAFGVESMIRAALESIKALKEELLRKQINIVLDVLPTLNRVHFDDFEQIHSSFNDLIRELENFNENSRYSVDIRRLQQEFNAAKKRELVEENEDIPS
ncbi:MAG: hypothetical protein JXR47_01140 [Thiotrichales bacterium]|nr:hypothetical protein [Thiotrichales bacterium]